MSKSYKIIDHKEKGLLLRENYDDKYKLKIKFYTVFQFSKGKSGTVKLKTERVSKKFLKQGSEHCGFNTLVRTEIISGDFISSQYL